MIYQLTDPALSRLYKLIEQLEEGNEESRRSLEAKKVLRGHRKMQKSFAYTLSIKAPFSLQEQWVNEDRARFDAWLDGEHFPYIPNYKSIPFEEWLDQKTGGAIFCSSHN